MIYISQIYEASFAAQKLEWLELLSGDIYIIKLKNDM